MVVPNPGHVSPWARRFILKRLMPVVRVLFRPTISGLEHLPADRPFLLVANHSAGMGLAEIFSFVSLYARDVPPERPLAGFAHHMGFKIWPLKAIHPHIGTIPSTYEAAYDALDKGVPILVFPGGDHETLRPIWQAGRVDFGGRKGFLRIARQAGVPIVPMGITGSHFTAPILLRSRALATVLVVPRLMGLKRWGVSLLAVLGTGALALTPLPVWVKVPAIFLWLSSPLTFAPIIPWTIRFKVGQPIEPQTLFPGDEADDEELTQALAEVQRAIQRLVG